MQRLDNIVGVFLDIILRDGAGEVKESISYVNMGFS